MDQELVSDARMAAILGALPVARRRVARGYTPVERWVVELDDGRSVFVKASVNELTAGWLRNEHRFYAAVEAPFLPRLLGWADDERPMLVLEDLSAAFWPPPWTDARLASALRMLRDLAATSPPPWLPPVESSGFIERGWRFVRDDPESLLAMDAGKFFTTPHYDGYPAVLVRLPAVDADLLRELLTDAWSSRAPRRLVADFDAVGPTRPESSPS